MMRHAICLLLGLCLVGFAWAQEEKASTEAKSAEAIEILKKVDATIKAVDSVRYDVKTTPEGIATDFVSAVQGTTIMEGWNGNVPDRFHTHVKTTKTGTDEPLELTGGGDGETYFIINHTTKKAYEDMDPAVMGSAANTLRAAAMVEFVHDTPFDDELHADEVELQGIEKIGNEKCYKIHVVYAGGQGSSTWYFSKKDYLPRRRTRHIDVPQGSGSIEVVITNLETNPEVSADLYKLKLPEGYEQIDDFHP